MGNRAVITFDKKPSPQSLGIYLHWNGGAESVVAFMDCADHYGIRADDNYEVARFAQIIGNFFGGTLSVGIGTLETLDCENHDNGVFIVDRSQEKREVKQFRDGNYNGLGEVLNLEQMRATHPYFTDHSDGGNMVEQIRAKNDAHFGKGGAS